MEAQKTATLLIETQYLGNIEYYARLTHHKTVLLEQHEHYVKSTYRNRCYIAMPDGPLRLSVPLARSRYQRRAIKDVRIDYSYAWQRLHWNSLCTAYRSSPYFEYYEDTFYPYYHKPFDFLLDFNQQLCAEIVELLQLPVQVNNTKSFQKSYAPEANICDFRSVIHPRKTHAIGNPKYVSPTYHQVFENKIGFLPNLSIIDLLFAEGPNAVARLQDAIQIVTV